VGAPARLLACGLALLVGASCAPPPPRPGTPQDPHHPPDPTTGGAGSDRCQQARGAWPEARRLRDEGRLRRAREALDQAERRCPELAPEVWPLQLDTLVDLGDFEAIQALAARILRSGQGSPALVELARQRGEEAARSLVPLDPGPRSKARMRATYAAGQAALAAGDFAGAEAFFLRAWSEWHPNGQAIERAATAARRAGHEPRARALFDRALVDLLRAAPGGRVSIEATDGFDGPPVPVFSPDGASLYVAHGSRLSVLATATLRERARVDADDHALGAIALSADGRWLATGASDGAVRLRQAAALDGEARLVGGHRGAGRGLAFSADGAALVSAGFDGGIRVFDVARGVEQASFEIGEKPLAAVAVRDHLFITSGPATPAQLRDLSTGHPVPRPPHPGPAAAVLRAFQAAERRPGGVIQALEISADGRRIVVGRGSGQIEILDPRSGAIRPLAEGDGLGGLALSPDSKVLAWGSEDRRLRVWHLAPPREVASLARHSAPLIGLAIAEGHLLLAPEGEGLLRWATGAGALSRVAEGSVTAVATAGGLVAAAMSDRRLLVVDAATGSHRFELQSAAEVRSLGLSNGGQMLATAAGRELTLWDLPRRRAVHSIAAHEGPISAVAVAGDGALVASGASDRLVKIWDGHAGVLRAALPGHTGEIRALAFSPDGLLLASGGADGHVRIWQVGPLRGWDPEPSARSTTLAGHGGPVTALLFSPDGAELYSGSEDGTARRWSVDRAVESGVFPGHGEGIRALGLSGRTLVAAGGDGSTRLWRIDDGKAAGLLRAVRGGGAYAVAADGRGELVGPASLRSFFTCLVGPLRFALDLCEDQRVSSGLLASLLGTLPPETSAAP
jgi:WD40 repeat protein